MSECDKNGCKMITQTVVVGPNGEVRIIVVCQVCGN